MITINELFSRVTLQEAKSISGLIPHLPHLVETAIYGNPEEGIQHLKNVVAHITNKKPIGTISNKGDGKASFLIAKGKAKPKGETGEWLSSPEEVDEFVKRTGKNYLRSSYHAALELAHHPEFPKNKMYQADTLIEHSQNNFKGNVTVYEKKKKSQKYGLAVHTIIDAKTGKKIGDSPDLRHMESDTLALPYLGLQGVTHYPKRRELKAIEKHISTASKLFKKKNVSKVVNEIAQHVDPTNKTGHRHLFFRSFNNAFQRGDYDHIGDTRSVEMLLHHGRKKMQESKSPLEIKRLQQHLEYVMNNKSDIEQMLQAHHHMDAARDIAINILHRSNPELRPVDRVGNINHNLGEGWVSNIPGANIGAVKLVPREFTRRNVAESEAAISRKKIHEEGEGGSGVMMTASSGAIAGMGYNLGKEGPDDLVIRNHKTRLARRKIAGGFLRNLNVGGEV